MGTICTQSTDEENCGNVTSRREQFFLQMAKRLRKDGPVSHHTTVKQQQKKSQRSKHLKLDDLDDSALMLEIYGDQYEDFFDQDNYRPQFYTDKKRGINSGDFDQIELNLRKRKRQAIDLELKRKKLQLYDKILKLELQQMQNLDNFHEEEDEILQTGRSKSSHKFKIPFEDKLQNLENYDLKDRRLFLTSYKSQKGDEHFDSFECGEKPIQHHSDYHLCSSEDQEDDVKTQKTEEAVQQDLMIEESVQISKQENNMNDISFDEEDSKSSDCQDNLETVCYDEFLSCRDKVDSDACSESQDDLNIMFSKLQIEQLSQEISEKYLLLSDVAIQEQKDLQQFFSKVVTNFVKSLKDKRSKSEDQDLDGSLRFMFLDQILNSAELNLDLEFEPYKLMQYMDKQVEEGIINQRWTWDVKEEKTANCKIWANYAGSQINKDFPMMKTEHYFHDVDDPRVVMHAYMEHRLDWDDGIEFYEELEQFRSENTVVHRLLLNSIMNMNQREFIDKKLVFTRQQVLQDQSLQNGAFLDQQNLPENHDDIFIWVTSAPDDLYPISTKFVRSDSLVGIIRIGRIASWPHAINHLKQVGVNSTRGCYFHYISQTDVKIGDWTQKLLVPIIPKQLKDWGKCFRHFLKHNQQRIKNELVAKQN